MAEDNVELVRRAYLAANRKPVPDIETLTELFAIDHLLSTDWGAGDGEEYRGMEGFQRVMAENAELWEDFSNEVEHAVDAGDERVAVVIRARGRGKSSGAPVDRLVGAVITIRDGQIASTEYHSEPADAFAAAGLGPP